MFKIWLIDPPEKAVVEGKLGFMVESSFVGIFWGWARWPEGWNWSVFSGHSSLENANYSGWPERCQSREGRYIREGRGKDGCREGDKNFKVIFEEIKGGRK